MRHRRGSARLSPLVLSAAGVGLIIWAIIEGPRWGWTSVALLGGLIGGIGILIAFALVERRLAHPMLDVRLFKNARFTAASLSITTAFFALFGFIFLITQFLQLVRGSRPCRQGFARFPSRSPRGSCRRWPSSSCIASVQEPS